MELGPRNIFAFVSDTENKMKAVWSKMSQEFPWILSIPCAAHCFDLLIRDISSLEVVSKALAFCSLMAAYWRNHHLPKAIFERVQMQENGKVLSIGRSGDTRWKSQCTAGRTILRTRSALEKSVVDRAFTNECLKKGTQRQRSIAADVRREILNSGNFELVELTVGLLNPVAEALDVAPGEVPGIGAVFRKLLMLERHFKTFSYPAANEGLREAVISACEKRKNYPYRLVHALRYLLDPKFVADELQPS